MQPPKALFAGRGDQRRRAGGPWEGTVLLRGGSRDAASLVQSPTKRLFA